MGGLVIAGRRLQVGVNAGADVSGQAGGTLANAGEFGSLVEREAPRSFATGFQRVSPSGGRGQRPSR